MMANIPIYALLLFFNAQLFSAYTLNRDTLTSDDLDVLKALLRRLEVTVPEREEFARIQTEGADSEHFEDNTFSTKDSNDQPQTKANRAEAEEFLSARNLKAVRSDSASKRYSGCFGRRMDRIGSMSSLGCNTVGRHNLKRR